MDQENSAEVKLALLNAGVRLFFQRPPEFQHVLGRIFSHLVGKLLAMFDPFLCSMEHFGPRFHVS